MKEESDHLQDLYEIRSLMEKSSRFISLSGLSGIFAGIFALAGAMAAYWYMGFDRFSAGNFSYTRDQGDLYLFFFTDAAIILLLALSAGTFFTIRQSKRKGQHIWDQTSKRLLINMAIPLATGGLFCLALLHYNVFGLIAPATLIFYGLALLNASKFTLDDVRYLAFFEIALGLLATLYIGYGLLFWALGFGLLHIIYGTVMYLKYEKQ
jgi:hypothetical protein